MTLIFSDLDPKTLFLLVVAAGVMVYLLIDFAKSMGNAADELIKMLFKDKNEEIDEAEDEAHPEQKKTRGR